MNLLFLPLSLCTCSTDLANPVGMFNQSLSLHLYVTLNDNIYYFIHILTFYYHKIIFETSGHFYAFYLVYESRGWMLYFEHGIKAWLKSDTMWI